MNRRELMKMGTAAAAGLLLQEGALRSAAQAAQGADLRRHRLHRPALRARAACRRPQADAVQSRQAQSRTVPGRRDADRRSQRAGYVDALKGRDWDVVVDDSGYFPAQVQASAELLKDHVQHYIYRLEHFRVRGPDAGRHRRGLQARAARGSEREGDHRKELRRAQGRVRADRREDVRRAPGRDPSDVHRRARRPHRSLHVLAGARRARRRNARAGRAARSDPVHRRARSRGLHAPCVEQRIAGRYNLCNPPGAVTMGDLLETSKRITQAEHEIPLGAAEIPRREQAAGERRAHDLVAADAANTRARRW